MAKGTRRWDSTGGGGSKAFIGLVNELKGLTPQGGLYWVD